MKATYYHALQVNKEACRGCMHCIRSCPTEAIRIRDGKAFIYEERCIDCGECFVNCPVGAVYVEQDDFKQIQSFTYKVALLPAVFVGQCPEDISTQAIYDALKGVGFTHVFEIEQMADFAYEKQHQYVREHQEDKPLISTFCPAIVRLIQVRFPGLTPNLILQKPPLDMSAFYCKEELMKQGAKEEEIGLFYITPCAAKIAAVKTPEGEDKSIITGVINMNYLYNLVIKKIKADKRKDTETDITQTNCFSSQGVLWSLTNGEERMAEGRALAIDGVHLVGQFLEKVEDDELSDVDFLELRACDQGCAGGILVVGNRFLTVERLKKRSKLIESYEATGESYVLKLPEDTKAKMEANLSVEKIKPRSIIKLDENMVVAMQKMEQIHVLQKQLPNVDCGMCGAPSCQAFAEDIVKENVPLSDCVFLDKGVASIHKIWKK